MDRGSAEAIVASLEQKERSGILSEEDKFQQKEALGYLIEVEHDVRAMSYLGGIYYEEENYPLAEKYYLMAYASGDKEIANCLGFIYYYGRVDAPDYAKAYRYYSEAAENGNLEAEMKLADMVRNGYGVPASEEKYEAMLRKLWKKMENDLELFHPIPEVAHRLADLERKEGHLVEAKALLSRGKEYIVQRLFYSPFWGNFIVCRRIEELEGSLGMIDEENPDIYDLFFLLKTPSSYALVKEGESHEITSYFEENKIRVRFDGVPFSSIEDFLRKGKIGSQYVYQLFGGGAYLLLKIR